MGNEIKTVIGSRRTIRDAIANLVVMHKPLYDVDYKRHGLHFIATIYTGNAIDTAHKMIR